MATFEAFVKRIFYSIIYLSYLFNPVFNRVFQILRNCHFYPVFIKDFYSNRIFHDIVFKASRRYDRFIFSFENVFSLISILLLVSASFIEFLIVIKGFIMQPRNFNEKSMKVRFDQRKSIKPLREELLRLSTIFLIYSNSLFTLSFGVDQ